MGPHGAGPVCYRDISSKPRALLHQRKGRQNGERNTLQITQPSKRTCEKQRRPGRGEVGAWLEGRQREREKMSRREGWGEGGKKNRSGLQILRSTGEVGQPCKTLTTPLLARVHRPRRYQRPGRGGASVGCRRVIIHKRGATIGNGERGNRAAAITKKKTKN